MVLDALGFNRFRVLNTLAGEKSMESKHRLPAEQLGHGSAERFHCQQ